MGEALGMIETVGFVTAVQALDASLKAAQTEFISLQKAKGGLVTIFLRGDVAAVQAAIAAGQAAAVQVGRVHAVLVIARPAQGVVDMLMPPSTPTKTIAEPIGDDLQGDQLLELKDMLEQLAQLPSITEALPLEQELAQADTSKQAPEEKNLEQQNVSQLRATLAKQNPELTNKQLRQLGKSELIAKIRDFEAGRDD